MCYCSLEVLKHSIGLLTRFFFFLTFATLLPISVKDPDDVINGKSDVAPLDINALYHIEFREDPSYVDDNAMRVRAIAPLDTNALNGMESREDPSHVDESVLYAMHLRTKKLRSFKVLCFLPFCDINWKPCLLLVNATYLKPCFSLVYANLSSPNFTFSTIIRERSWML